jgi:hypothetical protein
LQVRKVYKNIKPELVYEQIKGFAIKQGTVIQDAKLYTSVTPDDTSLFIHRGTIKFSMEGGPKKSAKECLTVHLLGKDKGSTRVIFDIDEKLFNQKRLDALLSDLDFILGSYETKG